jgi:peroxiredoxin
LLPLLSFILFAQHFMRRLLLLLYWCPTPQACKFRDEYEVFQKAGAVVFGISSDSPEDNKAFATAQRLPFPLLTDPSSILRKVSLGAPLEGSVCNL